MPTAVRFALFATAIGECALAWNDAGLTGVWLPETRPGGLKRKIERRAPTPIEATPSDEVAEVITAIQRLLAGAPVDLRAVRLDWTAVSDFARRVYAVAQQVAPGRVVTYGTIARELGGDADARAVGQALGANPFPIVVPCHRVIAADGRLGGFSAPGGTTTKQRMLAIERARPDGAPGLFDEADAADSALEPVAGNAPVSSPAATATAAAKPGSTPAR
jgi:methylated-DNA-[protein]-cysteine S-methyltransferase